jgi:hypothetical protein
MNRGSIVVLNKDNFNEDEFLELYGDMSSKDFVDFVGAWLGFFNGEYAGVVNKIYSDKVIITYFNCITGWNTFSVGKDKIKLAFKG